MSLHSALDERKIKIWLEHFKWDKHFINRHHVYILYVYVHVYESPRDLLLLWLITKDGQTYCSWWKQIILVLSQIIDLCMHFLTHSQKNLLCPAETISICYRYRALDVMWSVLFALLCWQEKWQQPWMGHCVDFEPSDCTSHFNSQDAEWYIAKH